LASSSVVASDDGGRLSGSSGGHLIEQMAPIQAWVNAASALPGDIGGGGGESLPDSDTPIDGMPAPLKAFDRFLSARPDRKSSSR